MKKIIVLVILALVFLTACQSNSKKVLSDKEFVKAFNESKVESRRVVFGDSDKEKGKSYKMIFANFSKAGNIDSSKQKEVEDYFVEFSKKISDVISGIELVENQDTKRHNAKMLYRFDVDIDKDAYVIFDDGYVMIVSGDEIKNFNIKEEDVAKFQNLKDELLAKIESLQK